jgi:hypothetical protein
MTADIDGLWPPMRARVRYMLEDPEAKRLGVWVVSAFRPIELQAQLFADAIRRYGSEAAARKWVAPPGKSNHGPMVDEHGRKPGPFGQAVDLGVEGQPAVSGKWPPHVKQQMDALCARYGLRSPMAWEDWHYEPLPGFVDVPPADAPVPVPVSAMEDDDMIATDPSTGDYWVAWPDGRVDAYNADGTAGNRFYGNPLDHPEWNVGPGKPLGPVIGIAFWPQGQPLPGEPPGGYVLFTRDDGGRVHPYHCDAGTRKAV